jgi:hypothetical protein
VGRQRNVELTSASFRTKSRLFDQRGPSNAQDDRLFFAEDLLDEPDNTYYDQDINDSASPSQDEAYFYAQQSAPTSGTQSGGMDAYEAQFTAMNSQSNLNMVDNDVNSDEYWEAPESQLQANETPEQSGDTTQTSDSSSQAISDLDARVLESILQEGKLDLTTEDQVKKLLEGPRKVEEGAEDIDVNSGTGEYSSKFVSVSVSFQLIPDIGCQNVIQHCSLVVCRKSPTTASGTHSKPKLPRYLKQPKSTLIIESKEMSKR